METQEKINEAGKLVKKQKLNVKMLLPKKKRKASFENSDGLTSDFKPVSNFHIEAEELFDVANLNNLGGSAVTATPGLPPRKNSLALAK